MNDIENNNVGAQHLALIRRLMQSGESILQHMTSSRMNLLHAAVGISGEVGELEKSVYAVRANTAFGDGYPSWFSPPYGLEAALGFDMANKEEELGDILFYVGAYRDGLLVVQTDTPTLAMPALDAAVDYADPAYAKMLEVSYNNWRAEQRPKKMQVCNLISALSVVAAELLDVTKKYAVYNAPCPVERAWVLLNNLEHTLLYLIVTLGFSEAKIREANMAKLNKRYPKGYSNKAAAERADKREVGDE